MPNNKTSKKNNVTQNKKNTQKQEQAKNVTRSQRTRGNRKAREQRKDKSLYDKDFRNASKTVTENSKIFMDNANPAAVYEVPITLEAVSAPIYAAVCHALQRGWAATVTNPAYPYYAYVYMSQILVNYITSGTPIAQQAPKWLPLIGQALISKTVPLKNGKGTYKFSITSQDASNLSWLRQMGPLPYQKFGNLGVPVPSGGEGQQGPATSGQPAAYTLALGADAYMSFTNYSNQQGETFQHEMLKTVSTALPSRYMSVVSAFSVNRTIGGGNANCGSPASVLELEVPVTDPVLGVFVQRPENGSYLPRYGRYSRAWEGDGLTVAGLFMSMKMNQLAFKDPPKYKFVDFNEIVEVVYLWIEGVQNKVASDPEFVQNLGQNPGSTLLADLQCPLTQQEIRILLRAVLMNLFKDTQYYVQGLYPNIPTSSQDNQFISFVCAAGTCAYPGVTEPKFPLVFIENWRLLTMRVNHGQRGGKQNPNIYIPVLGQFFADTFTSNGASITVTTGTEEAPVQHTIPSFFTAPNEEVISMIDGSTGSGTYKLINDPGYVSGLITVWNEWINVVSSYSTELGTVGTDGGITSLTVLPMTKHIQIPTIESKSKVIKSPSVLSRIKRIPQAIPESSPYYNKNVIAFTGQSAFIQHSWETYQQFCIMPINFSSFGTAPTTTFYTRYQAIKEEPHNLIVTESDKLYRSFNGHLNLANLAIKEKFTKKSEIDIFLTEAAKHGRGGILSSLGSMLAGAFGAPEPITNAIKMIPL